MSIWLEQLLKKIPDDTLERVDRIRKRINAILREAIRKETGLVLNRQAIESNIGKSMETVSVPVRLEPGFPDILKEFKFEDDYVLVAMLSRYRVHLQHIRESTGAIATLIDDLSRIPNGKSVLTNREGHIKPVNELAKDLLQLLDKKNPVQQILAVDEDILGCYFYHIPSGQKSLFNDPIQQSRMELYWGIIGLIAEWLGVSAETLTAVVLAHETAHAYTHLGADIDGKRWDSGKFAKSDHALKEGLAQYYTFLVCHRLETQVPGIILAYEELLKNQPKAYQSHLPWIESFTPEEVRLAMLEIRRHGEGNLHQFVSRLENAREKLRTD